MPAIFFEVATSNEHTDPENFKLGDRVYIRWGEQSGRVLTLKRHVYSVWWEVEESPCWFCAIVLELLPEDVEVIKLRGENYVGGRKKATESGTKPCSRPKSIGEPQ